MCYPKLYRFKIHSDIHIHENKSAVSLECVSLRKKNNSPLLVLKHMQTLSFYML